MSVQSPETLTSWPANHSSACSSTHTHTPTHSHQLHLHLRFSSVASQQTEGGSGNHRGDRDSAFVSPDPLWENSVWPPWPSGCGVCVRAGNHCMMTMPYVIRHKLTFCPQEEHSLAFVLRRPTPRRVWGCGDERLDERASLLPRDDLEIVTQWFTSVQVELSLSPCLDLKKHPDDLLIRHVSPCVVTGVCFHWSVCVQCVDFGADLSLQRRPACWIPTGSTSLEIQGVERRPQNRGRHVWRLLFALTQSARFDVWVSDLLGFLLETASSYKNLADLTFLLQWERFQ